MRNRDVSVQVVMGVMLMWHAGAASAAEPVGSESRDDVASPKWAEKCRQIDEAWSAGDWEAVLRALDTGDSSHTGGEWGLLVRVWALASLGRVSEANAEWARMSRDTDVGFGTTVRAKCDLLRLDRRAVGRRLERLEYSHNWSLDAAEECLLLASALVRPSESAAALRLIEEALLLDPNSEVAAAMRSEVLMRLQRLDADGRERPQVATSRRGADGDRSDQGAPPAPGERLDLVLGSGGRVELVWVPAGAVLSGESNGGTRQVGGFWMMRTEVTQQLWQDVMGFNPSRSVRHPDHPVDSVSWFDVVEFAAELTRVVRGANGLELRSQYDIAVTSLDATGVGIATARVSQLTDGRGFRLPTEAEWEHACRSGTSDEFAWGDDPDHPNAGRWIARGGDPSDQARSEPIGTLRRNAAPNRWGLFDMHGNVAEWCWDAHVPRDGVEHAVSQEPPQYDVIVENGSETVRRLVRVHDRVVKGGSMHSSIARTAASDCGRLEPSVAVSDVGVRLVLPGTAAETGGDR